MIVFENTFFFAVFVAGGIRRVRWYVAVTRFLLCFVLF